jgi:hypothetical protein
METRSSITRCWSGPFTVLGWGPDCTVNKDRNMSSVASACLIPAGVNRISKSIIPCMMDQDTVEARPSIARCWSGPFTVLGGGPDYTVIRGRGHEFRCKRIAHARGESVKASGRVEETCSRPVCLPFARIVTKCGNSRSRAGAGRFRVARKGSVLGQRRVAGLMQDSGLNARQP